MKKLLLLLMLLPLYSFGGEKADEVIRINQVGLYPDQEKVAVIEGGSLKQPFTVKDNNGAVVLKGKISRVAKSPWSGKQRGIADFSKLRTEGNYTFVYGDHTYPFTISSHALDDIANATLHLFYIQRSGMPIEEKYAGQWHRTEGHPDTVVYVHPSAATDLRPAGTVISSPAGWYDAGDYNKYIVNSAFTIGQMLTVYEVNTPFFEKQKLNIPENGNSTPDILDEIMYNLKWMLTMQDPDDGGVYHKLTNADFDPFVMPDVCTKPRYVVSKSTAATLDFAAVMALASRIYKGNADYPDFSERAAVAAEKAWKWASEHPTAYYDQNYINSHYKPNITTGTYDDNNATDEFYWAATELYMLTHKDVYLDTVEKYYKNGFTSPSWADVAGLATYEWAISNEQEQQIALTCKKQIVDYCNLKSKNVSKSNFQCPSGDVKEDFPWGCLGGCFATPGITCLFAYHITHDKKFITLAQESADYILGRNATGYCYITGFGQKSPQNPHHRISSADGVAAPVPGMLVGGPNPGQQDKIYIQGQGYTSDYPDESYIDNSGAFACNEIAINWNSAAVGLFSWLAGLEDE